MADLDNDTVPAAMLEKRGALDQELVVFFGDGTWQWARRAAPRPPKRSKMSA